MRLIIAGIGTEVGKTLVSAVLCRALKADYWKPVQAGELDSSDSHKVAAWSGAKTWPEAYRLTQAMSPHAAAAHDGVRIEADQMRPPSTPERLVIELAGGLMVPLREDYLNIDLIAELGSPVLLVVRDYLGSINHTLLSLALLQQRNIPLAGLVFTDTPNPESRAAIQARTDTPTWLALPHLDTINPEIITYYATRVRQH